MPNLVTRLIVSELERELAGAEGLLFVSFGGLTVKETESLRNRLAEKGVRLRMLRNSLAHRVLAGRGLELPAGIFTGNVAVAYGASEAAIVAAKAFTEPEVLKAGKVTIRAGLLEGRVLGPADAKALASVPDRNTLRAQLLGVLSGPARGLVMALQGLPGGVTRLIDARARQLEATSPAPAGESAG